MGKAIMAGFLRDPQLEIVGAVEKEARQMRLPLPDRAESVPFTSSLAAILGLLKADVVVDFSSAEACMSAVRVAAENKVNVVTGTTGITAEDIKEIRLLAEKNEIGMVVASNFALGAVLLQHCAKLCARYFDTAEVIERHHNEKADAPSGTALATARAMVESRGKPFNLGQTRKETLAGTRGGLIDGIAMHAIRLPGYMATQEVVFGAAGQHLVLQHDAISRDCYLPGVIMAVKEVVKRKGLTYGLDTLLGL
jgi:4-hydroxy-tetrahydrodipicolinate reductase